MIDLATRAVAEELTPAELERLATLLAERSGLAFPETRWPFLRNRAREVMARGGFTGARRWLADLEASAARRGKLFCALEEALQDHETTFFRCPAHYRFLADVVVPARLRVGGPRVRIVSLGCATGEEAYSIAMAVRETVRGVGPSAVEILALDVSRAALVTGVRGAYPAARAAAVPAPWLAKYLLPRPEGFAVGPALREMVRFRPHDVRRGFYLGKFDVIFACNVLVYFTAAMRRRVLAQLAEAVAPGGYLFLGHAEEVTPPAVYFDPAGAPGVCVYRRNETACDGAAPAPLDAARPLTCSAVETAPADRPLDGD